MISQKLQLAERCVSLSHIWLWLSYDRHGSDLSTLVKRKLWLELPAWDSNFNSILIWPDTQSNLEAVWISHTHTRVTTFYFLSGFSNLCDIRVNMQERIQVSVPTATAEQIRFVFPTRVRSLAVEHGIADPEVAGSIPVAPFSQT